MQGCPKLKGLKMEKKIDIIVADISKDIINKILELEKNNETLISDNQLNEYILNTNVITIIAKNDNKIVGFLIAKNLIDSIDLEYILVDKNSRNMNIGSHMLNMLFDASKKLNITKIILEVRKSNITAINLYEKNGFKIIHKREKYYKDNLEDALIMEKIII